MKRTIAFLLLALTFAGALAQEPWPNRPMRLIVPFAPGSAADIAARAVLDELGKGLGQPVTVDNRAGGLGQVGMQAAARAKPDGYTFVVGSASGMSVALALGNPIPYDPIKDFVPVGFLNTAAMAFAVRKDHPARSLEEFVAMAKNKKLSYATSGALAQLIADGFEQRANLDMLRVNYKATGDAILDVMAGRVDLLITALSSIVGNGGLRPLAVASPARTSSLPSVPTLIEAGYKDFQIVGWSGVFAPAGTPERIVARFNLELNKAVGRAEVRKLFETLGADVVQLSPAQISVFLREDIARLDGMAKAAAQAKDASPRQN